MKRKLSLFTVVVAGAVLMVPAFSQQEAQAVAQSGAKPTLGKGVASPNVVRATIDSDNFKKELREFRRQATEAYVRSKIKEGATEDAVRPNASKKNIGLVITVKNVFNALIMTASDKETGKLLQTARYPITRPKSSEGAANANMSDKVGDAKCAAYLKSITITYPNRTPSATTGVEHTHLVCSPW